MSWREKAKDLAEKVVLGPDTDKELDDEIRNEQRFALS